MSLDGLVLWTYHNVWNAQGWKTGFWWDVHRDTDGSHQSMRVFSACLSGVTRARVLLVLGVGKARCTGITLPDCWLTKPAAAGMPREARHTLCCCRRRSKCHTGALASSSMPFVRHTIRQRPCRCCSAGSKSHNNIEAGKTFRSAVAPAPQLAQPIRVQQSTEQTFWNPIKSACRSIHAIAGCVRSSFRLPLAVLAAHFSTYRTRCVRLSQSTSARLVSRSVMLAGSSTVLSMASSQMVRYATFKLRPVLG